MGSAGDRFGRRRMLLIGSTGFAVVSVVAAFAPTAEALIAARAALGFFGAMLMPSTLSLLRAVFTDREQRRLAIAIWASGFAAGSALGPLVGGLLLEHFAWGSVFLLAVPVLVPMLVLVPLLIPESRDPAPGRIDLVSTVLSLAAMGPIVYGIKSLATEGVDGVRRAGDRARRVLRDLVRAPAAAQRSPMLDVRLFRQGSFGGAVLVNLFSVIALVGFLYFVSQHLQLIAGLSPVAAGLALLPGLVAMIAAGLVVVPIARRVRPRVLVPVALGLSAAGYLVIALSTNAESIAPIVDRLRAARRRHRRRRDGLERADPLERAAREGRCGVGRVRDGVRARRGARHGGARAASSPRSSAPGSCCRRSSPTGRRMPRARRSPAPSPSPSSCPRRSAAELAASAARAFDGGVVVTSLIGVALMVAAAIVAAIALRNPAPVRSQ